MLKLRSGEETAMYKLLLSTSSTITIQGTCNITKRYSVGFGDLEYVTRQLSVLSEICRSSECIFIMIKNLNSRV